jgi:hypothetical protein
LPGLCRPTHVLSDLRALSRKAGRFRSGGARASCRTIRHLGIGYHDHDWNGRTGRRHRRIILELHGVLAFDAAAKAAFRTWLLEELFPTEPGSAESEERIDQWFVQAKRERPGGYRLDRIIRSARQSYDELVFQTVIERLDQQTRRNLDALLEDDGEGAALPRLRADPGRVGMESILEEAKKLECLRALALPADILRFVTNTRYARGCGFARFKIDF